METFFNKKHLFTAVLSVSAMLLSYGEARADATALTSGALQVSEAGFAYLSPPLVPPPDETVFGDTREPAPRPPVPPVAVDKPSDGKSSRLKEFEATFKDNKRDKKKKDDKDAEDDDDNDDSTDISFLFNCISFFNPFEILFYSATERDTDVRKADAALKKEPYGVPQLDRPSGHLEFAACDLDDEVSGTRLLFDTRLGYNVSFLIADNHFTETVEGRDYSIDFMKFILNYELFSFSDRKGVIDVGIGAAALSGEENRFNGVAVEMKSIFFFTEKFSGQVSGLYAPIDGTDTFEFEVKAGYFLFDNIELTAGYYSLSGSGDSLNGPTFGISIWVF